MGKVKPKILEVKKELLRIVLKNKRAFSCVNGSFLPFYRKGTFVIDNKSYRFHWQNYVTPPHTMDFINITTMDYKTVYAKEIKQLLKLVKE